MVAVEREIRNSLGATPSERSGSSAESVPYPVFLGEFHNVVKQAIGSGAEEIEQIYNAGEERLRS